MDVKKQNEKLREEIAELRQKLSLLEAKAQNAPNAAEDQARLKKIFNVFDRDHDGALSGVELQDLALQLGEFIPNSDVAACLAELAPAGKLGFDEFHRWWRTPQDYHREDPGNKKLRSLRVKLQTRPLLDLMASICSSPSFEPARLAKWPAPRPAETAKVDVTVNMGMFDTVAASVRVQLIKDAERTNKIRTDLGVTPRACVIGASVVLQPECVDARLREFREFVIQLLEENRKDTTYSSFQLKEGRSESGQRLLWVYIILENKREVSLVQEVVETIDVRSLDVNLALSQKPGDPNDGFIKARLSVQAEASRSGIEWIVSKITSKDAANVRRVFNLLSGITGVAVRLDATDLATVFPKIAKNPPISTFQGWASVSQLLAAIASSEVNEETATVYNTTISVLSAPHSAFLLLEDKMVQATFDNLHVTEVLPSMAELEAAARGGEEGGDDDDDAPPRKPAAHDGPTYRSKGNRRPNPLHEDAASGSSEEDI